LPTMLSVVSVETTLYVLIVVLAAAIRFSHLGLWPLLAEELPNALPPLELIRGNPVAQTDYSPLLFTGNLLTFLTVGPGDAAARLLAALFGTILVALPYALRHTLGRIGSLAASLLLAVSPSFLHFSCTAVGSGIVAACALAFVAALLAYQRDGRRWQLAVAVAAVALALLAGGEAYTLILVAASLLGIAALTARSEEDRAGYRRWLTMGREALTDRGLVTLFLGIILLVATAFFWNPAGLQAGLNLLADWFSGLRPLAGGRSWYYYLELLLVYEAPITLLGLIGLARSVRRRDLFGLAMAYWFMLALLFYSLLGPASPGAITVLTLPLVSLAARTVDEWVRRLRGMRGWDLALAGLSVPLLGLAYLNLAGYLRTGVVRSAWVSGIVVGLLAASIVALWAWIGKEEARRVGIMVILLVLTVGLVKTSVRLNYHFARHPIEPMVIDPVSPDQRALVRELTAVSSHFNGDQHEIDVLVEETLRPALSWCLRDFPNVQYAYSIPAGTTHGVVIEPAGGGGAALASYAGMTFHLRSRWPQQTVGLRDRLRWLVLNERVGVLQWDDVKLWVRMAKG